MSTALVIIDVQDGLLTDPARLHDPAGVLDRIGTLVERARAADVPVVFVQHDGGDGHPLAKGSQGWPIHPATGHQHGDTVVEKRHCDAFHQTSLEQTLKNHGADRLVLAGMCSDYCVDTTCRRAFSMGYSVVLAEDAHTTFSRPHLSADLIVAHHNEILGSDFAQCMPSATIELRS